METMTKAKMPTPAERPDLYDGYDGGGLFRDTGVKVPDRIQKLIDAKKAAAPAARDSKL